MNDKVSVLSHSIQTTDQQTLTLLHQTPCPVGQAGHGLAEGQPADSVPGPAGMLPTLTVS